MARSFRSRRRAVGVAVALAALLGGLGETRAHDYWLVPHVLLSPAPVETPVSLFVGDDFVAEEEKEMQPDRAARFVHVHTTGTFDLLPTASAGQRPVARVGPLAPGGHLFVLDRTSTRIEIEAKKFDAYLQEEGLSAIVTERARRGESGKPGREKYERFLKALVQVGATRDDTHRREVAQSLEMLPATDPTEAAAGSTLAVTIRWNGAPLAGAHLERLSRTTSGSPSVADRIDKQAVQTGPDGIASVSIPRDGVHLLRLVHMVRCEGCPDADWRSYWASYTFASGPADVPRTVTAPPMLKPEALWQSTWARAAVVLLAVTSLGLALWRRRTRARRGARPADPPRR